MSFVDALTGSLALTIDGTTVTIRAGDVKRVELTMHPWGYEGSVDAWVVCETKTSEDTLFDAFFSGKPIDVALTLGRSWDDVDVTSSTVTWKGLVVERSVTERTLPSVAGEPVLQRMYSLRFQDRAQALWREHRPTNVYVDSTYQTLFSHHLPTGVSVTHSWSASTTTHAVLAFALGSDRGDATFFDFAVWLASKSAAGVFYAIASDTLSILDAKPTSGATFSLVREQVASVEAVFPEVRRAAPRVLNSWTEAPTSTKAIQNDQSVTSVRADHLLRSSIGSDLDARVTLETTRAKQHLPGARVTLSLFPTTPIVPSQMIAFGEEFSAAIYQSGTTYRATTVLLLAVAEDQSAGASHDEEVNRYRIDYVVDLEPSADPVFHHAPHEAPVYPFFLEGKVLSETGATTDETYQSYTDSATSLDEYKVKVSLFADEKVVVLYEPLAQTGQFYFPLYRDERVLLSFDFDVAKIRGFLDWRSGLQLPLDSQGNQLIMGKKAQNETSMKHVYTDEAPVFSLTRSSSTDLQLITISEGTIRLTTSDH